MILEMRFQRLRKKRMYRAGELHMVEIQAIMEEILKGMQRKYRGVLEIERLTKELADMLSVGDRESVQLLLNMRQGEIEKTRDEDYALHKLLDAVEGQNREYLAELMNGKESSTQNSAMEQKICQLAVQTKHALDKTIAVDRVLSKKLAGNDSYYQ